MRCSLCGNEFDENSAASSCEGCIMAKKCRMVKCPNCGYETPKEPEWIKRISRRLSVAGRRLLAKMK
ncbi:MAG: hypothetical protein WAX69_06540 [Victivallales bacterium]